MNRPPDTDRGKAAHKSVLVADLPECHIHTLLHLQKAIDPYSFSDFEPADDLDTVSGAYSCISQTLSHLSVRVDHHLVLPGSGSDGNGWHQDARDIRVRHH